MNINMNRAKPGFKRQSEPVPYIIENSPLYISFLGVFVGMFTFLIFAYVEIYLSMVGIRQHGDTIFKTSNFSSIALIPSRTQNSRRS